MKILVDKLPETWHQCPEHTIGHHDMRPVGENMINACKKHPSRNFECKIGEPGFECPYYKELGTESSMATTQQQPSENVETSSESLTAIWRGYMEPPN